MVKDEQWLGDFYVKNADGSPEELVIGDSRDVQKIVGFVQFLAARLMRGAEAREELVSLTLLELGSKYRRDKDARVTLPYVRTIMGGFKGKVIYNQQSCHLSDARSLSSVTLQAARRVRAVERRFEYEHGRVMGVREREELVERVRASFGGKVRPRVGFADRVPVVGFEGETGSPLRGASGVASMVKDGGLVGRIGLVLVSDSVYVGAMVGWLLDGRVEALAEQCRVFLDRDDIGVEQLVLVERLVSMFVSESVRIVDVCEVFGRPENARVLLEDMARVGGTGVTQGVLF